MQRDRLADAGDINITGTVLQGQAQGTTWGGHWMGRGEGESREILAVSSEEHGISTKQ